MINCHYGGSLVAVDPNLHSRTSHPVRFQGEPWQSLWGKQMEVNSFHEYGITAGGLGRDLVAFSFSGDGTVEGLHHSCFPVLGLRWHPERCRNLSRGDGELLRRLFSEASFWNREVSS